MREGKVEPDPLFGKDGHAVMQKNRKQRKGNMNGTKSEYALAGVDYAKIAPFKRAMVEVAKKTAHFPEKRKVKIPYSHHTKKSHK